MSPALIVTLIIVGIVVMVGAALIAQSLENARKEKLRQIAIINERIRHLSAALSDIPNNYMTADLRQFVIDLIRKSCSAIFTFDAKHSGANAQLKKLDELSKQTFPNELDSLQPPFDDPVTGQNIRARLKDLVNILVNLNKDGNLEKSLAVKYVNQGKMMFELISIDLSLLAARHSEKDKNTLKAALINYNSCLKKLQKINTQSQFSHRIGHLQAKTQQLQEKFKLQVEEATALAAKNAAMENENRGSDSNEDWKIKQDYE